MSMIPRILPNGNVLAPVLVEGKDARGHRYWGDALEEIKPTDRRYKAARADAERLKAFVNLEEAARNAR